MNTSKYTVTMTYSDLLKWQKLEQDFNKLKTSLIECFNINEDNNSVQVNITNLKNIGKNLLPDRYQEFNYEDVR